MEIEGLKLKGITLKELLLPKFIEKIENEGINANTVSLVFVREEGTPENKILSHFIFSHQNSEEIKDKILHINGSNEEDLKKFSKILKELKL